MSWTLFTAACPVDPASLASQASLDPMIEDGDDLRSLFNFLRSLQALCRRSLEDGRAVLVAQLC